MRYLFSLCIVGRLICLKKIPLSLTIIVSCKFTGLKRRFILKGFVIKKNDASSRADLKHLNYMFLTFFPAGVRGKNLGNASSLVYELELKL